MTTGVAAAAPAAVDAPPAAGRAPRTLVVPRLALDCGATLADVTVAYHLDGPADAVRDDLVLVFHALTGGPDAVGDWWRAVAGPGRAVDTTRHAVLCCNLLGSCYGTTGPADAWALADAREDDDDRGRDFPPITPRDMARLAGHVVERLGARSLAAVVGGSLGGMVAQEFALLHPGRARALVVLAAPAQHSAWAIGWNAVQRAALDAAGPEAGLAVARMVAMLSFRTADEVARRFGRAPADPARLPPTPHARDEPWAVGAWLLHHGERLVRRFDARSYRTLLDAMDAHDVGRGRGGLAAALRALGAAAAHVVGVGIPGDVLYPPEEVRGWAEAAGARYVEVRSTYGHDAFLLESAQVGAILADALAAGNAAHEAARPTWHPSAARRRSA